MSGWRQRLARRAAVAPPYLWLLLFFLVPFLTVLAISFSTAELAMPPFRPLVSLVDSTMVEIVLDLGNYAFLVEDDLYVAAFLNSLEVAAVSTVICLLIGYPMAYGIARAPRAWRLPLLMLVVLPFWTSFLIRVYAWIGLLNTNGLINGALLGLGLIDQPLALLRTDIAVYIGIVYAYLPFMVLPLYATLERLDPALLEAAFDLGARPFAAFAAVTLPLTWPGIASGSLLVFVPAVGEFVIPELLGGADTLMIGKVLWTEFFNNRDWPLASAVAVVVLVVLVGPILLLQRVVGRDVERGA